MHHRRDRGVADLEGLPCASVELAPQWPREHVRDRGVQRGVGELLLRQPLGRPVRHLLDLRQLEPVEELGRDVGELQPAALGAEREARHQQGAVGVAQLDALRAEHGELERAVVDNQVPPLERLDVPLRAWPAAA